MFYVIATDQEHRQQPTTGEKDLPTSIISTGTLLYNHDTAIQPEGSHECTIATIEFPANEGRAYFWYSVYSNTSTIQLQTARVRGVSVSHAKPLNIVYTTTWYSTIMNTKKKHKLEYPYVQQ